MQELKAIAALLSAPASFVNHCRFDDIEASDQASIGGIIQLVAFADLILRRLYFAARLKGEGRNNERATDAQVLSRVDGALGRVQPSLPRLEDGLAYIAEVRKHVEHRNKLAHWAARRSGAFLIFATANERQGQPVEIVKTTAYWVIARGELSALLDDLQNSINRFAPLSAEWLAVLRPELGPAILVR